MIQGVAERWRSVYLPNYDPILRDIFPDIGGESTNRWQSELASCENQLIAYDNADMPYYENGKRILELAQNAQLLYLRAKPEEKRRLLKLVLSNLRLNGLTVGYEMRNPFHNFVKWVSRPALLGD